MSSLEETEATVKKYAVMAYKQEWYEKWKKVELTCGGLGPQKVRVGGDLVLWVGLQHGVGRAAVQQGHLALSDGGWGLVKWGSRRRRGWW